MSEKQTLNFEVSARVSKPVEEVFEGVADPDKLSGYFTTGGAKGRLETGATVMWDFHDYPGAFPVDVIEVEQNRRIILEWEAYEPGYNGPKYKTTVTMTFEPLDENTRTLVTLREEGWPASRDTALKGSYGNCMGWSHMLAGLKVYLEHGINLRDGMYK
ncbi:MAG: ATPase [Ponticaulis sp.]|nr:ATPase [Ponticaulis sp.]